DPDAEAVQGRLQPVVDFLRGEGVRRIDMRQPRDGDVLEEHGWTTPVRRKGRRFYRLPAFTAPLRTARHPRRSAALPAGEALGARGRLAQRLDHVGAQARRLVAGQGLQLVTDLYLVALVEGHAVLDRDLDLALADAAGRGPARGDHAHRLGLGWIGTQVQAASGRRSRIGRAARVMDVFRDVKTGAKRART